MKYTQSFRILGEIITFTIKMLAKDKKSLIILLLMPFILIAVLGAALSSVMGEDGFQFERAKLAIVDEDQTIASRLLVDNGFNNKEIMELIQAQEFTREEAEKQFSNQEIDGILYLHKGYEASFIFGKRDKLILKLNPTKAFQGDIVKQIINQYHVLGKMVVDSVNEGRAITNFPSVNNFLEEQPLVFKANIDSTQKERINSFQYYSVGMGVMYVLFTMFTGVGFIITERQLNTLNRIKMIGFSQSLFYLGKSLAFMLISLLQLLILFISSHYAFGVSYGDYPIYLFAVMLAYSLAISGLMILLIGWVKNQNTLNVFFSMGVPIIAALGGSMLPVGVFPSFIEPISNLLPNRWAIEAFLSVMLNRPEDATNYLLILLTFAIVTAIIGIWQLNRKETV